MRMIFVVQKDGSKEVESDKFLYDGNHRDCFLDMLILK